MSKAQVGRLPHILVLLALVLVSVLPVAGAQVPHIAEHTVDITAEYDSSFVDPISEIREVLFDVSVECPRPSIETQLAQHALTVDIRSHTSWAHASLDKTTHFITFSADECLQGTKKSVQVVAAIAFTAQAPAFDYTGFRFTAAMDSGEKAEHEFTLHTGFYERWQARFETNVVESGPSQIVQVPLTIENHGNGAIRVQFEVDEQTSSALTVAPVGDQIVQSLIAGGETNRVTVSIDVRTPDEVGRRDQMVIDVSGSSVGDPSILLSPIQISAVVETTEGGGETVEMMEELPGLTSLMVFFVLFVGLALRRR